MGHQTNRFEIFCFCRGNAIHRHSGIIGIRQHFINTAKSSMTGLPRDLEIVTTHDADTALNYIDSNLRCGTMSLFNNSKFPVPNLKNCNADIESIPRREQFISETSFSFCRAERDSERKSKINCFLRGIEGFSEFSSSFWATLMWTNHQPAV